MSYNISDSTCCYHKKMDDQFNFQVLVSKGNVQNREKEENMVKMSLKCPDVCMQRTNNKLKKCFSYAPLISYSWNIFEDKTNLLFLKMHLSWLRPHLLHHAVMGSSLYFLQEKLAPSVAEIMLSLCIKQDKSLNHIFSWNPNTDFNLAPPVLLNKKFICGSDHN